MTAELFRKPGSPLAIRTEAASLAWLAAADGASVAELVEIGSDWLTTRYLASGSPSPAAAAEFGRRLAVTHAAGADRWGAAPPGFDGSHLDLAGLPAPADNTTGEPRWRSFGEFYAEARIRPYLAAAFDSEDQLLLHRACDLIAAGAFDSPQPGRCGAVARIHGDLWGGNVVWARVGGEVVGTLIDPCAHGGHAETDLAELALFGSAHLADTLRGYHEVSPLADGWQERIELHQLHMLVTHARLFGGGYVRQSVEVARRLLRRHG